MSKQTEKLKALLRLSREGMGNEKTTAGRFLKKHLKALGMTVEDLEEGIEAVKTHEFRYNAQVSYDRELLSQIAYQVTGSPDRFAYTSTSSGRPLSILGVDCTQSQAVEIRLRQEIYRRAMVEEVALAFDAFVQVNQIFGTPPEGSEPSEPDSSEYIERLSNRMLGMPRTKVNPQLDHGGKP